VTVHTVGPLPGGSEAWWILQHGTGRWLVLAPTEEAAGLLFDDYQALEHWRSPDTPSRGGFFSEDNDERLTALSQWARGELAVLFAPREAVDIPLQAPDQFAAQHRHLRLGDRVNRDDFFAHLLSHGYERVETVEQPGEVAVRGEVMDLWSPGWEGPLRTLWPFDQIESIRKIDLVHPTVHGLGHGGRGSARAHLPNGRTGRQITLLDYLGPDGTLLNPARTNHPGCPGPARVLCMRPPGGARPAAPTRPAPVAGHMDLLAKEVRGWIDKGLAVLIFCHNPGEQERVEELILEQDRSLARAFEQKRLDLPLGSLTRGFFGHEKAGGVGQRRIVWPNPSAASSPEVHGRDALQGVAELKKGDYVVHEQYGIGRFMALERKTAGGMEADYLRLEYRGGDRLFVPLFEFRQVRKFIGTEGKRPVLSSLDTGTWDQTRAEVEQAVAELARELLARAAQRSQSAGFSLPGRHPFGKRIWCFLSLRPHPGPSPGHRGNQTGHDEPDPHGRLVCGDVGYGKTEVAMRAAFKAVCAGKQVALLVPTTIWPNSTAAISKTGLPITRCAWRFCPGSANPPTSKPPFTRSDAASSTSWSEPTASYRRTWPLKIWGW
jgi:transcription-repair coupling factor (superfamily II helicase)